MIFASIEFGIVSIFILIYSIFVFFKRQKDLGWRPKNLEEIYKLHKKLGI